MIGAAISETMNQPGITVKGEDDWLLSCKKRIEIFVRKTVRVFARRLQCHQVNHINDAPFQLRKMLPENINCGKRLKHRYSSAPGHHHLRLRPLIVARPSPDPEPGTWVRVA